MVEPEQFPDNPLIAYERQQHRVLWFERQFTAERRRRVKETLTLCALYGSAAGALYFLIQHSKEWLAALMGKL